MITHTTEQIIAKLRAIYGATPDPVDFNVVQHDGGVKIAVKRMYDVPSLSFAMMMELAEFFDTKMIETDSEFYHGGCETCDYGSSAGYTLHITEGESFTAPAKAAP